MLRKFYLLFFFIVAVFSSTLKVKAQEYSLIAAAGQKVYVPITATNVKGKMNITNYGRPAINNFDYTLSFNGTELYSKHYVLPQALNRYDDATIEIDVPPYTELGEDELIFTITKVNGTRNSATVNYSTLPRVTVTKVPHRRVVVEDYTAMWCRYCPRGIALMENLAHKYGDDFIGIAVHTGRGYEPLYCEDYAWNIAEIKNYPTLTMNRSRILSSYIAQTEFEEERSKGAYMDVEASAMWDKEKNNITVTPRVTFRLNRKEAPYGFAYVLTEDGMSNPRWAQANIESGNTEVRGISSELDYFIDAASTIYNLKNNSVAIAAEGVKNPVTGKITAPIKADEPQSHTFILQNISNKSMIQDKSKLSVCIFLINTETGYIENATKCAISDFNTTGISSLSQGEGRVVETARYALDGRRITAPQKGINLVKFSDGSVRKEVVTQ